ARAGTRRPRRATSPRPASTSPWWTSWAKHRPSVSSCSGSGLIFRRGRVVVVAAVAALLSAAPAHAAPARPGPGEILAAQASRDSARALWLNARWSGTLASLRAAQERLDRASERYATALDQATLPSTITARDRNAWTKVAMYL